MPSACGSKDGNSRRWPGVMADHLFLSLLWLRLRERLRSGWRLLRSGRGALSLRSSLSLRASRSGSRSRLSSARLLSFRPSAASCSALRSLVRSERALASRSLSLSASFSPSTPLSFALHVSQLPFQVKCTVFCSLREV